MPRQTSYEITAKGTAPAQKSAKPRDPVASGERDAASNRMAGHNYFFLEKFEAGISLRGTEVKSIRDVTPVPHNGCRPRKKRRV